MTRRPRFQIFPDGSGAWRWRLKAANGRVISTSGEAFDSKGNARRAAEMVYKTSVAVGPVHWIEEAEG